MAQSKAATVDEWMAGVAADRREALERLRALCRERLTGWEEMMRWGMPGYGPAGADPVVSFNSQKQHVALYVGETVVERFADRLEGVDRGKGCVRYRRPAQIDWEAVGAMLDHVRERGGPMR